MKELKLISAIIVLLVSGTYGHAQETSAPKTVSKCSSSPSIALLLSSARPIDVSEEVGAWTVQILTSGGIFGNSKNELILTSAGNFTLDRNSLTESKTFTLIELQPFAELVSKMQISRQVNLFEHQINQLSHTSLCSDCYKTTFILSRRAADKTVSTFVAKWDPTTIDQVAEDVLQIYKNINLLAVKEQTAK